MENSSIYEEFVALIEKNWIVSLSELRQRLQELEKAGQITAEEHHALLALYFSKLKPNA